jgi:hypothetical protein
MTALELIKRLADHAEQSIHFGNCVCVRCEDRERDIRLARAFLDGAVESRGGETEPGTTVELGELDAINGLLWGPEREIFRDELANTRIAPHLTEGASYHVSVVLRKL